MHLVDVWPLHSLRLTTADLELRPTTEAELPALCAILPPDLEADPSALLLWSTGRIAIEGRERVDRWVWRAASRPGGPYGDGGQPP